jgi:hypothetical protein
MGVSYLMPYPYIYAEKMKECTRCEFMLLVRQEESRSPLGFKPMRMDIESTYRRRKKT